MAQKYILAPYVKIGFENGVLNLGFGSLQKRFSDLTLQNLIVRAAHYWKEPKTPDEVFEHLKSSTPHDVDASDEAIRILLGNPYLIKEDLYRKNDRFSRHHLFYALSGADPVKVQGKISEKHVVILGCGGIGNLVSVSLATAGVGELTLIDNDNIELSNLTRQILFTEEDIGQSKGAVLRREIEKRASNVKVNVIDKHLNKENAGINIPSCDLIVLSADSPGLVNQINQYAIDNDTPFINVGYIQDIAVWGPFVVPGKTGCYACQPIVASYASVDTLLTQKVHEINQDYQAPSIGPINMMAASHALLDIMKYLGEFGQIHSFNKRIGIWTHNLQMETQNCALNVNCLVCGAKNRSNKYE